MNCFYVNSQIIIFKREPNFVAQVLFMYFFKCSACNRITITDKYLCCEAIGQKEWKHIFAT